MSDTVAAYRLPRICVIVTTLVVAVAAIVALVVVPARKATSSAGFVDTTVTSDASGGGYSPPTVRPPTPTTSTSTTSTSRLSQGLTTVQAADFSIGYPTGWAVDALDVVPTGTNYRDTTIKRDLSNPHYVVRVDVMPGGDASRTVAENVAELSTASSYRQITRQSIDFVTAAGTYDAILLEFTLNHPDTGVQMHTVDVFFNDSRGRTFAVLTRAPESEYDQLATLFSQVRSSIAPR